MTIKIIISICHAATTNAPLLLQPPPRCPRYPNMLLLPLKLHFHQAAASAVKLAAAIVLPPPPPLPTHGNNRATTAYKKKGIVLTNLFFTMMVTASRSNDCGSTRQQR
jgi:hypothetical protein